LQQQLDAATDELSSLADELNRLGSVYARLKQEESKLMFQINNPGKPVPNFPPLLHMRPPA
jgi:hypothetical protein